MGRPPPTMPDRAGSAGPPPAGVLHAPRTPLVPVVVPIRGRRRRLWLKLEGANEYGSIKARTARSLIAACEADGRLRPGSTLVESTSGNLGVALAGICRARGYGCVLVVESGVPEKSRALMLQAGARLVTIPDSPVGNPVERRLDTVRRILRDDPDVVWTDQYASSANPRVHRDQTAPELAEGLDGAVLSAVAAVVSTGGTLAGLSAYFRREHPGARYDHPNTKMICVDAVGSAATGGVIGPRPVKIPGFGSGRPSDLLRAEDWDLRVCLRDEDAALACQVIRSSVGLLLGGSAGGAVLGAVIAAANDPELTEIGVICPDLGDAYLNTIYAHDDASSEAADSAVREGLAALTRARISDRRQQADRWRAAHGTSRKDG